MPLAHLFPIYAVFVSESETIGEVMPFTTGLCPVPRGILAQKRTITLNETPIRHRQHAGQAEKPMTASKDGPLYGAPRPTEGGCSRLLSPKYLRRRHLA